VYDIQFKRQVEKDLRKIDRRYVDTILEEIEGLRDNPRPTNSRKMTDTEMTHRLRVGDYRIIYQVDDKNKVITIFYVRHRKDAYKK
jgi:mRNA interferase RelE/StbE